MTERNQRWSPERRAEQSERMKRIWAKKKRHEGKLKKKEDKPKMPPLETYTDKSGRTIKKCPTRYARNASPSITVRSRGKKERVE